MNPIQIMQQFLACLKKNYLQQQPFRSPCSQLFCRISHFSCSTFELGNYVTVQCTFRPHSLHHKHRQNSFAEAAKDTSEQLINSWETYLYCQQANQNIEQAQIISEQTKQKQPRPWSIQGQNRELRAVGLDLSYLSPFVLDSFDNTGNSLEFPPTETPVFSPNSPEYPE